jgi:FlaA1/EpsC-like NDP-sugar epimerase
MIKHRSQVLCCWFLFWDLVLTGAAWIGAYYIRFETGWLPLSKEPPDFYLCWRSLPIVVLLAAVAYHWTGQYAIHRLRRLREEVLCVLKGTALLSLFVMSSGFYLHDPYESRGSMVLFSVLTAAGVLNARRLTWAAVRYLRRNGYNQARTIVVGTGRVARKTARALRHASWMGFRNLGFVEEQPSRWTSDLDILGTFADLPVLIQKYQIAHVFIALPMSRFRHPVAIAGRGAAGGRRARPGRPVADDGQPGRPAGDRPA